MARLLVRWWHPVAAVMIAAGLGLVTNLVTDSATWMLVCAAVVLVGAQTGLSIWQGVRDQRAARAARDLVLAPLRPPPPEVPEPGVGGVPAAVAWLTAPFSPTRLWGQVKSRDALVAWCVERAPEAGVARVVAGPAGVGKSRLALAVAESLPAGWAAGWLTGPVDGVLERVVAAGDPTLVLVDDADREPNLERLLLPALRNPALVRLLLLCRDPKALRLPDTMLPQVSKVDRLAAIGEEADRRRWFEETTVAYAAAFGVRHPELPDRPVGTNQDTMLILHARALLTTLGNTDARELSMATLMAELVDREMRAWELGPASLPAGCDVEVLAEAVTVLMLIPAKSAEEAAEALRRVPQFASDAAHESRFAVARWARNRYPNGPDERLGVRPHLVGDRLMLDTLGRADLLEPGDIAVATPVLVRAHGDFPDALELLMALLDRDGPPLSPVITALLDTSAPDHAVDRAIAALVDHTRITDPGHLARTSTSPANGRFPRIRAALATLFVENCRKLAEAEPERHLLDLAGALFALSGALDKLGRYREMLASAEEAVTICRELADVDPCHLADLAHALSNLAAALERLGRDRQALAPGEEAVAICRELADTDPGPHLSDLAQALGHRGATLRSLGHYREGLDVAEESVTLHRELADAERGPHLPGLADSLGNLAGILHALGRFQEALDLNEEGIAIRRELAEAEPERHLPRLARALIDLGTTMPGLGRYQEALEPAEEAVTIFRELAETEPERYLPDLAHSLSNLGTTQHGLGRYQKALDHTKESLAIRRKLADTEPRCHLPGLAESLSNLGGILQDMGRVQEALGPGEEAIAIRRRLADAEPGRYLSDVAYSLNNHACTLRALRRHREALSLNDEAVVIRRELADAEPLRHLPALAELLVNRAFSLRVLGRHEEALRADHSAVEAWKTVATMNPELHERAFRRQTARLRQRLVQAGSPTEAVLAETP